MATKKPIYVEELYGDLEPSDEKRTWQVARLKPKREKKLAEYAIRNNIPYFLPQYDSERKYKYRIVKFTKPLFPGYFFTKCSEAEKRILIISGHIMTFLRIRNEARLLDELKQIYLGRKSKVEMESHPYLETGFLVRFKSGSLKGLKGIVKNTDKIDEVILQVNILRQAVSVKAKVNDLEILGKYEE